MTQTPSGGVRRALIIGINAYTERPLRGCVGDATGMAGLLRERFGFADTDITLLLDGDASLARVQQEQERLLQVTQPDDMVFFFYAGHGTEFEQSDGSESTGFGTTFCLQEDPREDLYDDDFGEWLDKLATRTEHVVLIIDCCHSGTITRDTEAPSLPRMVRQTKGPKAGTRARRASTGPRRPITSVASSQHVMIAACRDDQLASEVFLDDSRTTTSGALALVLARELRAAHDGDTWRDVFERAAPQVTALARTEDGDQMPVIEGRADRVLFGLTEFAPISPVRVTERARVNVVLSAGALHGVVKGTVFTIHAAGSKAGDDGAPLGRVLVTQVAGTTSRARILSEDTQGAVAAGTRAVSSARDSVAAALAIENTSTRSALNGTVSLTLMQRDGDGAFAPVTTPASEPPSYDSGERFAMRVTNGSAVPVFINTFYFDPDGTIQQLRRTSVDIVPAGGSFDIGTGTTGTLTVEWSGETTTAHIKLFASTRQVDLSYLTRLGVAARETEGLPLADTDDWTTVTAPLQLNGTVKLASGASVDVSGVSVTARGLAGTLSAVPVRATSAARGDDDPLAAALAAEGIVPQQSFVLTDAAPVDDGTRSANVAPPAIELQVPDAGEGFAQVAMTTDADGLVRWHFASALDAVPPTRDGTVPQIRTRTFVIPTEPETTGTDRSLLTIIGKKLIDVYVFPVGKAIAGVLIGKYAHDIEIRRVPYRVRSFTPDDYASRDTATVIEGEAWHRLAAGRALLMIHGTNSSSHSAFAALPRAVVEALHAQYEGRVFAFDHPTLTHTPKENIETLLAAIPEGTTLDVDIICHSRGGLVSRVLAERQDQVPVSGRSVTVNKVIFVGSPNAGTRLCEENFLTDYLDTLTNLLGTYPMPGASDIVAGVVMLAKIGAAGLYSALTGIHSMQPAGLFQQWLNLGTRQAGTRYFALASNYKPTDLALARLATYVLAGRVFDGARNDLVVPTDGVFAANGSSAFPIADTVTFDGTDGIPHTGFFGDSRVTTQIGTWLRT